MAKNNYTTGRAVSMPIGLMIGGVVSLLITVAGVAMLSVLIDREIMEWNNIGYAIAVILLSASFAGASISAARIKRRVCLVCASSGGVYFGMLMMLTILFFGGRFEAVWVTGGVILSGVVSALLVCLKKNDEKTRKRIRIHR